MYISIQLRWSHLRIQTNAVCIVDDLFFVAFVFTTCFVNMYIFRSHIAKTPMAIAGQKYGELELRQWNIVAINYNYGNLRCCFFSLVELSFIIIRKQFVDSLTMSWICDSMFLGHSTSCKSQPYGQKWYLIASVFSKYLESLSV